MSLVGTRPPTVDEWDKYELHHRARLATKPGLTVMWQISGRSNITDFEEVVKLDKQYISEWTMGLDMLFFVIMERSYFYNGRHRMASGAFLLMLESYYYIKKTKNNRYWICVLWPCIAILNSTSRTYLIMAAVFLLIAYYKQLKNKQLFYFSIIPIALISAVIIFNSDMMQYFLPKQVGVFDFWGSFTSGRTVFWAKDFEAFKNANIMHRLFGQGYNLIYYVNKKAIDAYIYAHNDYLNILIANGVVGLLIYIVALMDFIAQTVKRQKVKFAAVLLSVFIFAFNAFFNGEYNYPAATLSIMFLFLILGKEDEFECLE